MFTTQKPAAAHRGNFYSFGAIRVVAKLREMNIAVPDDIHSQPNVNSDSIFFQKFSQLEHAMLDWFEGRDYEVAQSLIHFRPPTTQYQVIRLLNEEQCPSDLSTDMLCPSVLDALAAVVSACDLDGIRVNSFRHTTTGIVAVIGGVDALKVEPITCEKFDLNIRDRVRKHFKGVRHRDENAIHSKLARLPGFSSLKVRTNYPFTPKDLGCMLFGFPGNWSYAMREALKQVGIEVKQSQAQELAAVFFGANSWHQLIKHQDELGSNCKPVAVKYETVDGWAEHFYLTSEEALFSLGKIINSMGEPLVITHFDLSTCQSRIVSWLTKESNVSESPLLSPELNSITCGLNDYWENDDYGRPEYMTAAQRILSSLGEQDSTISTTGILYPDNSTLGILNALLKRDSTPASEVIEFDGHAVVITYHPNPNGGEMLTAYAKIYQITKDRLHLLHVVAMYKAVVSLEVTEGKEFLVLAPNYGNDKPIEIPIKDRRGVGRLIDLSFGDELFAFGDISHKARLLVPTLTNTD